MAWGHGIITIIYYTICHPDSKNIPGLWWNITRYTLVLAGFIGHIGDTVWQSQTAATA